VVAATNFPLNSPTLTVNFYITTIGLMNSLTLSSEEVLREFLNKGEQFHWTGQPESRIFTTLDLLLVPFSFLWGGFAIFWEISAINSQASSGGDLIFSLFGIPFVVFGLYLIFGRFIYKIWKNKRTFYGITNRRVLELTRTPGMQLISSSLDSIIKTSITVGRGGVGTLIFNTGQHATWRFLLQRTDSRWGNTGLDVFGSGNDISFFDIKDVRQVNQLYEESKYKFESSGN
jgi:hypothetical protein